MDNKIFFFDIDGTLIGYGGRISKRTCEILREIQESGHRICIASGRSKGNLSAGLEEIKWDGYVLASGIYSEYQGRVVFHERIEREAVRQFLDAIQNFPQFGVVLENNEGSYVTKSGWAALRRKLKQSGFFSEDSAAAVLDEFIVIDDLRMIPEVNKMMYYSEGDVAAGIISQFETTFDFLPNSVVAGDDLQDGEIMKKGITKATGIEKVIQYAGYEQKDVVAFGDGHNDIEMIQQAGIGVAMGNSVAALKQVADLVTDTQEQDGISKAIKLLNLI